jgi:DNA-binding Xre family transcriptional regulator
MERERKLRAMILSKWRSLRAFALEVGIPPSTLSSALNNGKLGGMAVDYGIILCQALGITLEELIDISKEESVEWTLEEIRLIDEFKRYLLCKRTCDENQKP